MWMFRRHLRMNILPLLVLPFVPFASSLANFPIVYTSYGAVRGYKSRANNGYLGEIFKKIPYAAPPTGKRRWKKPVPPDPWNYTLDGTFPGPACAQIPSRWKGYVTGQSEDCLTLNIYTSRMCRESNASCPVIVFIHPGSALYSGQIRFRDDTLLTKYVKQGVIMVTMAYRLGVFGVMALGDENALPANLAMHDVRESLNFVRKEIHNFGGDKDQLCVMGHSTGATIVLAMVFSPAFNKPGETPLFDRAIAMSTIATFENEAKQVNRSHVVAAKLGCSGTAQEIIDCLRPLSTETILQAALDVAGSDALAQEQISGITAAGELMPIHNMKELRDQQKEHMSQLAGHSPTKLLIGTLLLEFGGDAAYTDLVAQIRGWDVGDVLGVRNVEECEQKYFRDVESGKFDPGPYDFLSQGLFVTTSLFSATQARAGGEVYLYTMDYPNHAKHGDDLNYAMAEISNMGDFDDNEEWISRIYPVYFTNFVRGLFPAPDWAPLNPELMNYYSINKNWTDGTVPGMKIGYHQSIIDYYEGMIQFDETLTDVKRTLLNEPVQMKDLTLLAEDSLDLRDILIISTCLCISVLIASKMYAVWRNGRSGAEKRSLLVHMTGDSKC